MKSHFHHLVPSLLVFIGICSIHSDSVGCGSPDTTQMLIEVSIKLIETSGAVPTDKSLPAIVTESEAAGVAKLGTVLSAPTILSRAGTAGSVFVGRTVPIPSRVVRLKDGRFRGVGETPTQVGFEIAVTPSFEGKQIRVQLQANHTEMVPETAKADSEGVWSEKPEVRTTTSTSDVKMSPGKKVLISLDSAETESPRKRYLLISAQAPSRKAP